MDLHYACTQCGVCCRNIKVPLTAGEALDWLRDGNSVQVLCEASPWPSDPAPDDLGAAHVRRRSFAAMSGSMPARIVVMLVANIVGNCPNLLPDMRCGIYGRRPLVCRIYPAEINPVISLEPGKKACPPEAWGPERPLFMRDDQLTGKEVRRDVERWRERDSLDTELRRRLCAALAMTDAAVAQEGLLVYSPAASALAAGLAVAMAATSAPAPAPVAWRFITDRPETVDRLAAGGAVASHAAELTAVPYQYIGLKRP